MEIVKREEPPLDWKLAQPIVWATLNGGIRIQELLQDKIDEVAELLRSQLIPREIMCNALNMSGSDPESCETLVQEAIHCMRDGFSIVGVVEEEEEEEEASACKKERVVAAMIARVIQKRDAMETFSRVKVYKGEAYRKYAELNNHMMRQAGLHSAYDTDSYYRIYHIVVHEDYKNRGISLFMGKVATHRLTVLFKQSICVKLCPDRPTQHLMQRLGFAEYMRLGYEKWFHMGKQVFFHTGVGNYSIVLMVYEAGELGDINETLEEKEDEPTAGLLSVFPGRAKTGQPSLGNRGHLIKPTPPVVTGRLADYRYLFQKGFDSVPFMRNKN